MKCGVRVALGVTGGYLLGRTKKFRLALMLGGLMAGRRVGSPRQLLAQGAELLRGSPEFARLSEELRGRLLDAGKQAAVAVATQQVDSLTERVSKRLGALGDHHPADNGSGAQPERDEAENEVADEQQPRTRPVRSAHGDQRERPRRNASRSASARSAGREAAQRSEHATRREDR